VLLILPSIKLKFINNLLTLEPQSFIIN